MDPKEIIKNLITADYKGMEAKKNYLKILLSDPELIEKVRELLNS